MKRLVFLLLIAGLVSSCSPMMFPNMPSVGGNIQPYAGDLTPMQDRVTGLYGYVNSSGRWVVAPQFRSVNHFYNGLARVEIGGYYGAINAAGKWVVKPVFNAIHNCEAAIRSIINGKYTGEELWESRDAARGLYGYLNHYGAWHIKPQYESISNFDHNGFAVVKMPRRGWGVIDRSGKWVIKPTFAYKHDAQSALSRLMR